MSGIFPRKNRLSLPTMQRIYGLCGGANECASRQLLRAYAEFSIASSTLTPKSDSIAWQSQTNRCLLSSKLHRQPYSERQTKATEPTLA